jgi:hypothetical protein
MLESCVAQLAAAKMSAPPDYASAYEKLKAAIEGISFLLKATLGQKGDVTKPGEFILTMLEESGVNAQSWERFNEVYSNICSNHCRSSNIPASFKDEALQRTRTCRLSQMSLLIHWHEPKRETSKRCFGKLINFILNSMNVI